MYTYIILYTFGRVVLTISRTMKSYKMFSVSLNSSIIYHKYTEQPTLHLLYYLYFTIIIVYREHSPRTNRWTKVLRLS